MNDNTDIFSRPSEKDKPQSNSLDNASSNEIVKMTSEQKLDELEKRLRTQQKEWGTKIISLVKRIKDINQLTDAQVDMLSHRHMIVDHLTKFRVRVRNSKSTYEKKFKDRFLSYYNYDYKINDKQKIDMANADLYFYRRQIGLLESHVDFFKECISTLDKMGFAIKNRINFEEV